MGKRRGFRIQLLTKPSGIDVDANTTTETPQILSDSLTLEIGKTLNTGHAAL